MTKKGLNEIKVEPVGTKVEPVVEQKVEKEVEETVEFGKPLDLRPKELPLIVKPKGGKWKNEAQERYAQIINAYAYTNPDKFETKKEVLGKRLIEIGNDPSALAKYEVKDEVSFGKTLPVK